MEWTGWGQEVESDFSAPLSKAYFPSLDFAFWPSYHWEEREHVSCPDLQPKVLWWGQSTNVCNTGKHFWFLVFPEHWYCSLLWQMYSPLSCSYIRKKKKFLFWGPTDVTRREPGIREVRWTVCWEATVVQWLPYHRSNTHQEENWAVVSCCWSQKHELLSFLEKKKK